MRSAAVIYVQDEYVTVAYILGVARSQSGGCRCLPAACIKAFCARHLQCKMPEDGKQHEGYMPTRTSANMLYRKQNQKLIAKNLFVYSVCYIQVSVRLVNSSLHPLLSGATRRTKAPLFASAYLKHVRICVKSLVVVKPHAQDT